MVYFDFRKFFASHLLRKYNLFFINLFILIFVFIILTFFIRKVFNGRVVWFRRRIWWTC